MSFALPKNFNELMQSRVAVSIGTAALATAVILSYSVMLNADGQALLSVAAHNLIPFFQ